MRFRALHAAAALFCVAAVTFVTPAAAYGDQVRDDLWHLRFLNVAATHKISQGDGVIVAVVDSGVDPHPDLRNNLLPGKDFTAGGSSDGRQDTDGHGTGMAGLIGAHGHGTGAGALGIAPKAKILPIRYDTSGDPLDPTTQDDIGAGVEWAVRQGAKVINISLNSGPSARLQAAIEAAIAADVVVVACSGNKPGDYTMVFPAMYDGVVVVGATDRTGNLAKVTVTGKRMVITAPGQDIVSTGRDGRYRKGTGTSDSTAIVSGAVALVRSKYPELSAKEVIHRLTATAKDKGAPGRDPEYGYGVLDLVAALTADVPALPAEPSASAGPSPRPTAVEITALPDNSAVASRTRTLMLLTIGGFVFAVVVVGIVVTLLVLRFRRRSRT